MTEIINLRQARKRAARAAQETAAAENSVKFGQTKAARKAQAQEAEVLRKALDGAKREGD
jgi:hypothetical protein